MDAMDTDHLAALDDDQRVVATTLHGPLCVLAGAGTGKTRAITHRIAHGVRSGAHHPQHLLAVTFTARAAGEMRSRLRDLGVAGVQAASTSSIAIGGTSVMRVTMKGDISVLAAALRSRGWQVSGGGTTLSIRR